MYGGVGGEGCEAPPYPDFVVVERDPGSAVHRFALHRVRDDFVA
ncbi:hypothetical protein ACVWZM_007354 [Bradyrhizobium sp. USDA 4501]